MAAFFFDSSALVKRFAQERGTAFVISLMRRAARHRLYAALFTEVEVCAALARRRKAKTLTPPQVSRALRRFRRDFANRFTSIKPDAPLIAQAIQLADTYELRGYDAIQLASVLTANQERLLLGLTPLTLVSADAELNQAAQAEGLAVEDPNNY